MRERVFFILPHRIALYPHHILSFFLRFRFLGGKRNKMVGIKGRRMVKITTAPIISKPSGNLLCGGDSVLRSADSLEEKTITSQ